MHFRKIILLFCSLWCITAATAQTMNIVYKDGTIQTEETSNIDYVNFETTSEGCSIGALNAKLDKLQGEYDELKSKLPNYTYLFDWLKDYESSNGIVRYINTSNATDVVSVRDGNELKFSATIHSPYSFCNIGFDIQPSLYAEESRRYVVLLTGSVRSRNLAKVTLRTNSFSSSEMIGQDYEEDMNVEFKTLMNVSYQKGKNDNDRYVFFSHYPKSDGKDIRVEYCISRYSVFEYKEGWSINDYISCYDKGYVSTLEDIVAKRIATSTSDSSGENNDTLAVSSGHFEWDVNMLINYGQSLSVGGGAANVNDDFRNVLSFPGGINEWDAKLDIENERQVEQFYGKDLVPLSSLNCSNYPPVASCALAWMSLLEKENHINFKNFDYQFLLSTPGYSGIEIEGLAKAGRFPDFKSPEKTPGYYYKRLLMSVRKGMENAHRQGKTFGVPCLFYVQGEADCTENTEEYYPKLRQLFEDLNTDIKAITGQQQDVQFITYQMSSYEPVNSVSGPTYAQLKLAQEQDNVHLGGAMYQYDYGTDKFHPVDRAIVGLQAGIIAKRIINDEKPLALFFPRNYDVQHSGDTWLLSIQFDVPVPPMRFITDP